MEKQNQTIGFSIIKINTEQFAIIEEGFDEKGIIRINTSLRFAADEFKKYIGVFASFIFDSNNKPFLIIEASCHFSIIESAWSGMLNADSNSLIVSKGFLAHLAMLTVGTTRGILHSKTEGSCFNKYFLPAINVAELIKEDVIFDFKNSLEHSQRQ